MGPTEGPRRTVDRSEAARLLADDGFRAALDALLDHVAIGTPVRDGSGAIVDFELVHLNARSLDGAGRSARDLVGRRVTAMFPGWEARGMLARFVDVVETGEPYVVDRLRYEDELEDGTPIVGWWSMSVVPFGDGYLAASRDVTELVLDEQARLEAEREAGRAQLAVDLLQRAALPALLPDLPGLALAARHHPASGLQPIGGDWYDAISLDDSRLGVVIADVSGHGVEAAAFMVQVRNVVRTLAAEHVEPATVLERADAIVDGLGHPDLFATCCYGVVDRQRSTFTAALAGHPAPLRLASGAAFVDLPAGPPLGVEGRASYAAAEVSLEPGDRVLLYTDGLLDERERSLAGALAHLAQTASSWGRLDAAGTVEAAAALAPGLDDVALLCLELTATS